MLAAKADIISELQRDILRLQGFKPSGHNVVNIGLGPILNAFPNGIFPLGCTHEFLSDGLKHNAATVGFVAGLLASVMSTHGTSLWISRSRKLFPPALSAFGIHPDRFVFVDVAREKDVIWAIDEALKCGALAAVVGEVQEISFTASRRLQLAVEDSKATGFIIHKNPRKVNTTACVSRWKITTLPSETIDELPGVGFPRWQVELLRIRNGKPGIWEIQWEDGKFRPVYKRPAEMPEQQKWKVG